jgi:hypothetical protein
MHGETVKFDKNPLRDVNSVEEMKKGRQFLASSPC